MELPGTGGLMAVEQALMQLPDRIAKPGELQGAELDTGEVIAIRYQPGPGSVAGGGPDLRRL